MVSAVDCHAGDPGSIPAKVKAFFSNQLSVSNNILLVNSIRFKFWIQLIFFQTNSIEKNAFPPQQ